jgi:UDP-N-acetylmuramoyl-tripeptide--D-alanyl-D-alanine ligase
MRADIETLYRLFVENGQKICTDTRNIIPGAIFFALKGANFNGNSFAGQAIKSGCIAAVIDEEAYETQENIFLAHDALMILQQLAHHHRQQFHIPVLAITGSNAKTTTKELINAALSQRYNTLYTIGNLNNHIGVPLTLLRLEKHHTFAIIEMGANHQKEIAALCRITAPDHGLITNIGRAHLEGFGGPEGVKKGKGELFDYLRAHNGTAFINSDDPVLLELSHGLSRFTYGTGPEADVQGKDETADASVCFRYRTKAGKMEWASCSPVRTQITGDYNFVNCLAAAAVASYFKTDDKAIRSGLENYSPAMNRSQLVLTGKNTVILDAYNANPDSMRAALANFDKYTAEDRLALLGDMFELGEFSADEHQRVADLAARGGFSTILVGEEFSKVKSAAVKFRTTAECLSYLKQKGYSGKTVLIKGSRGMKMEILKDAL